MNKPRKPHKYRLVTVHHIKNAPKFGHKARLKGVKVIHNHPKIGSKHNHHLAKVHVVHQHTATHHPISNYATKPPRPAKIHKPARPRRG